MAQPKDVIKVTSNGQGKVKIYFEDGTTSIIPETKWNDDYKASWDTHVKAGASGVYTIPDTTGWVFTGSSNNANNNKSNNKSTVKTLEDIPTNLQKFFVKDKSGKWRITSESTKGINYDERQELTKYLSEADEDRFKKITQSRTSKDSDLFYGGLRPEDYEYKFVVGKLGKEAADEMSVQKRRDIYFDFLGVDDKYKGSDENIYEDSDFRHHYYEKFKAALPEGTYRDQLKDDFKFGYEHYDNIPVPPPQITTDTKPKECPCTDENGNDIMMQPDENGECPPCVELCPDGQVKDPVTGECKPPPPPYKDDYVENTGPWLPDQRNVLTAMSDNIEELYPQFTQYDFEEPNVFLESPERTIAGAERKDKLTSDYIENTVSAGQQGVDAVVGATSGTLGQVADTIAAVENRNLQRLNTNEAQRTGIQNQEEQLNKNALATYIDKVNAVKQNVSDERDAKNANINLAGNRMLGNWYKKKWSEKVLFPQAYVDPITGDPYWTGKGRDPNNPYDTYQPAYNANTRQGMGTNQMLAAVQSLTSKGMSEENAIKLVTGSNRGGYGSARGNRFGYDPYATMDFGSSKKGGPAFGTYLTGGIFE